ncbi:MAG: glycosyltransferase [Flavobacteriales bacterium]
MHGTLGNFVERHIQAISAHHQCTVVYIVRDHKMMRKHEIVERINNGVREIICYYKKRGQIGCGYFKAFNHVMNELLEKDIKKFDLTHVHVLYKGGIIALQLKNKYKIPFIITEHWNGYHRNGGREIGPLQRTLSKRVAKHASAIVPVSEHLAKAMADYGLNSRYEVVPNVVNSELFKPTDKVKEFTFVHVSSLLDEHKNVSGIIRAFKAVSEKYPVNLNIIGDGNIAPYLMLTKELGLDPNRISISGEKTLKQVADYVSQAHCLILFSNYENQPCVIPEAHACGLPVIATDVGGISEHLTPSHGQLIPAADHSALVDAMTFVYSNYDSYNSEELRTYSVNHFSQEAISKAYSSIYHSIN